MIDVAKVPPLYPLERALSTWVRPPFTLRALSLIRKHIRFKAEMGWSWRTNMQVRAASGTDGLGTQQGALLRSLSRQGVRESRRNQPPDRNRLVRERCGCEAILAGGGPHVVQHNGAEGIQRPRSDGRTLYQ